jgi:hypothetical protein
MCLKTIKNLSRKKKLILSLIIVILLSTLGILAFCNLNLQNYCSISNNKPKLGESTSEGKLEERVACPADGVWTTPDRAFRHPLAVAIENHPDSRPQSGLDKASLIYETPTEGGITRFLTIYVENDVDELGPVRSARTYFLDWLCEFDGIFAHCGGSSYALTSIRSYGIKDLDEFVYPSLYWRSYGRWAPHNLYTSTTNLWEKAGQFDWDEKVGYESWQYKEDLKADKRPLEGEINIYYPNSAFWVKYTYNPSENNYLRFIVKTPHRDKVTQKQLCPKNVAVIWVSAWYLGDVEGRWAIETISEGQAKVFLDGQIVLGTWKKDSRETRIRFYNQEGKEIVFNRGQTWIQVVPEGTQVIP